MAAFTYGQPSSADEIEFLKRIETQCFVSSPELAEVYFQRIGTENFRVIRDDKALIGGLSILPMGQWFGGRCVPMAGIASVGIAPEHRGTGGAIALMHHAVRELHERGFAISTLYPAAQRLYRQAGYEQAGSDCGWDVDASRIRISTRDLPVQPVALQAEIFRPIYQQVAQSSNGNLDRHPAIWQQILQSDKEAVYAYLVGATPQGYIIFRQHQSESGNSIVITDWAALTAAAGRQLWSLLASHRSQIKTISWRGAAIDPFTLLLPEQPAKPQYLGRWMTRIIDVRRALEARGYPLEVNAILHLNITDDLIPENSGKFILSVAEGRGEVIAGGMGEMHITIQGLSPLYTGLFSPSQLQRMGYLDAPEDLIATATVLFSGTSPWMPDFF